MNDEQKQPVCRRFNPFSLLSFYFYVVFFRLCECCFRYPVLRSTLTVQWMQDDCECVLFIHCTSRISYRALLTRRLLFCAVCSMTGIHEKRRMKAMALAIAKTYINKMKKKPTCSSLYSVRWCSTALYALFDRIIVLVRIVCMCMPTNQPTYKQTNKPASQSVSHHRWIERNVCYSVYCC